MKRLPALHDEVINNKIYLLRGQKIMLDKDLAELYGVKPIRLREQIKRNRKRFPGNFMFRLSKKEAEDMVSQIAIPSKQHMGGSLPFAFTEHGVLMLANVLRSRRAIKMSVRIIEIFIKLREMAVTYKDLLLKLNQMENKVSEHDLEIKEVIVYVKKLINQPNPPRKRIGFRTQDTFK